jgi:hypothetical protein
VAQATARPLPFCRSPRARLRRGRGPRDALRETRVGARSKLRMALTLGSVPQPPGPASVGLSPGRNERRRVCRGSPAAALRGRSPSNRPPPRRHPRHCRGRAATVPSGRAGRAGSVARRLTAAWPFLARARLKAASRRSAIRVRRPLDRRSPPVVARGRAARQAVAPEGRLDPHGPAVVERPGGGDCDVTVPAGSGRPCARRREIGRRGAREVAGCSGRRRVRPWFAPAHRRVGGGGAGG